MPGGLARGRVADLERDAGRGPDPDAGHRDQDPGKRVCIEYLLHSVATLVRCASTVFRFSASRGSTRPTAVVPGSPAPRYPSATRGRNAAVVEPDVIAYDPEL